MTFFKTMKDGNTSVGFTFLKWNDVRKRLNVCDVDEGQFVQTFDEKNIYTASWMKPAPKGAANYPVAEVTIISETEFNDIKALLEDGEVVYEEKPVQEEVFVVEEPPEEDKPMTIAQMRELILEQQQQIKELMSKIK